jgi:hypothetical protein
MPFDIPSAADIRNIAADDEDGAISERYGRHILASDCH